MIGREVIRETFGAHIAKFFDTHPATERVLNRWLAIKSFREAIASFVKSKADKEMGDKKHRTAFVSKKPIDGVRTFNDDKELLPCHAKSESGKVWEKYKYRLET